MKTNNHIIMQSVTLVLVFGFPVLCSAGFAMSAPDQDFYRDFRLQSAVLGSMGGVAGEDVAPPPGAAPEPVRARGFVDVAYNFDQTKLDAAKDSFHFLRSYVDYFYLLVKANRASLQAVSAADNATGWCVGDAHPENFGALLLKDGSSVFTMNDIDDSGPCPVVLDLYRLMSSARLYDPDIKPGELAQAYAAGLRGQAYDVPATVADMLVKSRNKGTAPDPKKISGNRLVRDGNMRELGSVELAQLETALKSVSGLSPQAQLLDAVSTSKLGGGSGGLLRYEVLLNNYGALLHLELKEEVVPSIYPVAAGQIPATQQRVETTLRMTQGAEVSPFYGTAVVSGKYMLSRPRFSGNVGVNLDKQSVKDNEAIIRYEAYVLGSIHSRSVQDAAGLAGRVENIPSSAWENDVSLMTDQFNLKFSQLKQN
jgi:uncharacterized protein (DUF2252 family)